MGRRLVGKMSRQKGKRGEREAAALLREHGFSEARRGVQYQGGHDSDDVIGLPGWHVEVKRTETLSIYPALEQAIVDKSDAAKPVVLHKRNGKQWLAILNATDFLELVRRLP